MEEIKVDLGPFYLSSWKRREVHVTHFENCGPFSWRSYLEQVKSHKRVIESMMFLHCSQRSLYPLIWKCVNEDVAHRLS